MVLFAERTYQFTCVIHVFFTTVRAGLIQCHTCIQDFVPVRVGDDALIFKYLKIHGLKYLVLVRTNKCELHGFW